MSSIAGDRRWKKMNRPPPGEPWVWHTEEMLSSPAWRGLSLAARQVLDRVILEHMNHAGTENGNLPVTYDDFEGFGVRRKSIKKAIDLCVALGFLDVVTPGVRSYGSARRPTRYGITWLPRADRTPASNRWKRIKNREEAAPDKQKADQWAGPRTTRKHLPAAASASFGRI